MQGKFVDPVIASIKQVFPSAQIVGELGRGAFGVVNKALINLGNGSQFVAIKSYDIKQIKSQSEFDQIIVEKIDEEIKSLKALKSSSILRIFENKDSTDQLYKHLVLDFCDGGDLDELLRLQKTPFKEDQVKVWFQQLLDGLIELEQKKIVHRDIKPANLLLKKKLNLIVLGDFGASKFEVQGPTFTDLGSGVFKAPEISLFHGTTCKADVWSLGVTLYMLLFGKDPWNTYDAFKKGPVANSTKRNKFDWNGDNLPFEDSIKISAGLKSILKRMIVCDQEARAGWEEISKHPYFTSSVDVTSTMLIQTIPMETSKQILTQIGGNGGVAEQTAQLVQKPVPGRLQSQLIDTDPVIFELTKTPEGHRDPPSPQNAVTGANFFINRSNCSKVFHLSQDALATCARKRDVYHSGLWRLCGFLRVVVSHANRELVADALDMISDRRQPSEVATSFGPFYDNSDFGEVRTKLEKRRDEAATAVAESEKWLHSNSVSAEEQAYLEAIAAGGLWSQPANQIANKVAHVLWETASYLHQQQKLLAETFTIIKQGLIRVHLCLTYQQAMEFRDEDKNLFDWKLFINRLSNPGEIEADAAKAVTHFACYKA